LLERGGEGGEKKIEQYKGGPTFTAGVHGGSIEASGVFSEGGGALEKKEEMGEGATRGLWVGKPTTLGLVSQGENRK